MGDKETCFRLFAILVAARIDVGRDGRRFRLLEPADGSKLGKRGYSRKTIPAFDLEVITVSHDRAPSWDFFHENQEQTPSARNAHDRC